MWVRGRDVHSGLILFPLIASAVPMPSLAIECLRASCKRESFGRNSPPTGLGANWFFSILRRRMTKAHGVSAAFRGAAAVGSWMVNVVPIPGVLSTSI